MATFFSSNLMDSGLNHAVNNADELRVLKAYTAGDTYATVVTNTVCLYSMLAGDYALSDDGTSRRCTVAAQSGNNASASSGAAPDLHVAICDNSATEVVAVTDEVTDQEITIGNPVNTPAWYFRINQPTLV